MNETRQTPDSRLIAWQLLDSVLLRRRPLDLAFAEHAALARLSGRDRAFVRMLTATTLRRLGQIDAALDSLLDKPLKPDLARLQNLMRLAAAQLLFLQTPPHAAVSTALDLAQRQKLGNFKGLLNAVLRRLGREGEAILETQDAARLNLPGWLRESWEAAYGAETAAAIAQASLQEPPLDLTPRGAPAEWLEPLDATLLPSGSLRLQSGAGDVRRLPGYAEGAWWVQDAAAALPARLLQPLEGQRVIDLCAAPGGKTAQLAAAGARVTAVDLSEARLALVTENLQRLGLAAETVAADARTWRPQEPADAILLDAPCSASGTLRRHPDIAWLKTPEDVAALTATQDALLAAALEMLKPGGLLVYAVCSLQPEEGAARIEALLASGRVERIPVQPEELLSAEAADSAAAEGAACFAQGLDLLRPWLSPAGDLRTLPCHLAESGGIDGFYACRLRLKA
ncbi:MAG: 16S rRNA (cytosine(967)-C(5))-methyltransferase RsmB [Rhodovibrionaceae bacterium]